MKINVVLCYPPYKQYEGFGQEKRWLPLGIASIGAYLRRTYSYDETEIVLLDLFSCSHDDALLQILKHLDYDALNLVGYTCFTEQRFSTLNLARAVKEYSIETDLVVKNVIGGAHAFAMADQIYKNYDFVDIIVKGEGEIAWTMIVDSFLFGEGLIGEGLNGIIKGIPVMDLDDLPHAIDGFHMFENVPSEIEAEAPIVFSRGCTDYCSFCSTTKFWQGYRSRSPENVLDEMLKYYDKYKTTKFKFHDDASTADIKRWKVLCELLIRASRTLDIKFEFEITARADQFDEELIELLAEAGCKKVAVGIESGNVDLRKAMNKNLDIRVAKINMKRLMKAGIEVCMLFIVAYMGETDETIEETIELIREVKPTQFCTQPLMIFPATRVYSQLVNAGWIDDDYWLIDQPQPYYTREASPEKINEWLHKLQSALRKINVLLSAPVRQKEDIFQLYMKGLDGLEIPGNVNLQRAFVLHNCPHLRKYLRDGDIAYDVSTDDEYIVDSITHNWGNSNLEIVASIKNNVLEMAYKNGFDYVFFVDSDLILHPKTLSKLLETKKDIVAEIFWTSWDGKQDPQPNCWDFDHYSFYAGNMERYKEKGLYTVGGTGACILISRNVIEAGVNYSPIYNVVSWWGEDRAFCIRSACAGFRIWCDTNYPAFHIYRENLIDDGRKFLEGLQNE